MRGHLEVAKLLLDAGADVNASDEDVSLQQWHSSSDINSTNTLMEHRFVYLSIHTLIRTSKYH